MFKADLGLFCSHMTKTCFLLTSFITKAPCYLVTFTHQGRIQDFWKGGSLYKGGGGGGGGGSLYWFYLIFLKITWKWNNLVSLRPNYFIFIGYLNTGGGEGGSSKPLNPLWIRHCTLTWTLAITMNFGTFCVTRLMSEAAIANIELLSDKMNLLKF